MSAPFATFPITGITAGGTQPRQEINAWANNHPKQLSLFIQALRIFQAMDVKDQLSYFRIAGIHGLPATSWDNDPIPEEATKSYPGAYATIDVTPDFYCPHQSLIFPTWHRAYMLLFEQRLWEIMTTEIVPQISDIVTRDEWMEVANTWRMPYWDWAASPSVPAVVRQQTISVIQPDGSMDSPKWNPLYQFSTGNISTFQPNVPTLDSQQSFGEFAIFDDQPLSETSGTSRWGVGNTSPLTTQQVAGVVNNDLVDKALQSPPWTLVHHAGHLKGSLAENVGRLFSPGSFSNFAEFATTAHGKKTNPAGWLSIELIHNCIHDFIGGVGYSPNPPASSNGQQPPANGHKTKTSDNPQPPQKFGYGHMADLAVAAFDPIFWLHHCNVDRQLAIYQSLGYTKWWSGQGPNDPASNAPLFPFHTNAQFGHFNSDLVENYKSFGYTYDDLLPGTSSKADTVSPAELQKRLTSKYGVLRRALKDVSDRNLVGLDNDFIINVLYNRYALGGQSYIIHFFIGAPAEIPSSPVDYLWSPNHVGSIHTFSRNWKKNGVYCANCNKQQDNHQLSKGQVPVTLQLLQRAVSDEGKWSDIQHLGEHHIVEYLKDNLHWRAVTLRGESISLEDLPDLKVYFLAGKATHPESPEEPSTFSGYKHQWEATKGKVGGAVPDA